MPTLFAVLACILLAGVAELARVGFVRWRGDRRSVQIVAPLVAIVAAYGFVVVLALAFYRLDGVPLSTFEVVAAEVPPGYPASGKLEAGDRIIAVDGMPIVTSLNLMIDQRNGAPVRLTFRRRGTLQDATVQPVGHDGHWVIGVRPHIDRARSFEFGEAVQRALVFPIVQTRQLVPAVMPSEHADPGGPKRIADVYNPPAAPPSVLVLRQVMRFATYVLLLIVAVNLVRVVLALRRR